MVDDSDVGMSSPSRSQQNFAAGRGKLALSDRAAGELFAIVDSPPILSSTMSSTSKPTSSENIVAQKVRNIANIYILFLFIFSSMTAVVCIDIIF